LYTLESTPTSRTASVGYTDVGPARKTCVSGRMRLDCADAELADSVSSAAAHVGHARRRTRIKVPLNTKTRRSSAPSLPGQARPGPGPGLGLPPACPGPAPGLTPKDHKRCRWACHEGGDPTRL